MSSSRTPLQKEAEIKLIELVHSMLMDGNLKFAQLVRNALVEKVSVSLFNRASQVVQILLSAREVVMNDFARH